MPEGDDANVESGFRSDVDLASSLIPVTPTPEPAEPVSAPEQQVTEPDAQTEPDSEPEHKFDKGLQKLQQDAATDRREAAAREERLMAMLEKQQQVAPAAPVPTGPSQLESLRSKYEAAKDDPFELNQLLPDLLSLMEQGEQERRELSKTQADLTEQRLRDREELTNTQNSNAIDRARSDFNRDHAGLDFDAAHKELSETIGRDYPEWDQIPKTAQNRIATRALSDIAANMSVPEPEASTDEAEVARKKKASAGKVTEKSEGPPPKPSRLDMSDEDYINTLLSDGSMGALFTTNTD